MRAESLSCNQWFLPHQVFAENFAAPATKYVTKPTATYSRKVILLLPQFKMFFADPIKANKTAKVK